MKSDAIQAEPEDELLTVAEVAGILKVPVSWVYEHTRLRGAERVPHFKIGKYLRFRLREILDWIHDQQPACE